MPNVAHRSDDLLTTAQVAVITGWSVSTVNRKAAAGELPVAFKGDGRRGLRLFRYGDVSHAMRRANATTGRSA